MYTFDDGSRLEDKRLFKWRPLFNITSLESCRNSAQGVDYLTDELGRSIVH